MELDKIYHIGRYCEYIAHAPYSKIQIKGKDYIYDTLLTMKNELKYMQININDDVFNFINELIKILKPYKEKEKLKNEDFEMYDYYTTIIKGRLSNLFAEKVNFDIIKETMLNEGSLIKLMKNEENSFFETKTWASLSDLSKSDFSDAAKCLLIGAPTPAAMITLRGVEGILRKYYEKKTGNKIDKINMGGILNELNNMYKNDSKSINKNLIKNLEIIKDLYRNPTQHPDKTYTQTESERMFVISIAAIHDMCNDM
jgi:hypothetical protein